MDKQKTKFGLKELLLIGASLFAAEKANAGGLRLTVKSDLGQPYVGLTQYSKSIDGEDWKDVLHPGGPATYIDIWAKTNFNSPYNHLKRDSRSADSVSNYLVEIRGRGLETQPKNANIEFLFYDFYQENNFSWKNLVVELYDSNSIHDSNNCLGVFDAHDLANGDVNFPQLQVNNDLSYQIVVRPRNYADLNLDNKVNFLDKAIVGNSWLNTDANSSNGWRHYSDIDRNYVVDFNDLKILTDEWLFQGCDPNTFVKAGYNSSGSSVPADYFENMSKMIIQRPRLAGAC
jgi:hypothetical protein